MCGIAGLIAPGLEVPAREALVNRMVEALIHRGPDARRVRSEGVATVGVARLSVVDRPGGHQPMSVEIPDRRCTLAYNGEIYNFLEVRAFLESKEFPFRTRSDTETVLAAHARWGPLAVEHFDGMFAYALWEDTSAELLLVRDRLGIKPLFYADLGEAFAFASEPKALLALPQLACLPDATAILEYFLHGAAFAAGYITGERSFFERIHAIPPGHMAQWSPGKFQLMRYWSPLQELGSYSLGDARGATQEVSEAVSASVRSMLMGEVPIGTALSGGLDSSLLTAEATRAVGTMVSACITYRPGRDDPDAWHATLLSRWLNRERPGCHRLEYTYMGADRYLAGLDEMVQAFDEPHWELRQLAMFENYRELAHAGQTVVLTGEGADELFFGYYQKFPGFKSPALTGPEDFLRCWKERLPWVQRLMAPAFHAKRVSEDLAEDLIRGAVCAYLEPCWRETNSRLRAVQCWYLHTFLPWLLMVNDRCSMAHSLEGRFPYLSKRVVSLALRLPPEWNIGRYRPMEEKILLREAARDCLPVEIWRERQKSPLPVPLAVDYHEQIAIRLAREVARASPDVWQWLDREIVEKMLMDFRMRARATSRDGGESLTAYIPLGQPQRVRTAHLFGILSFLRWYELYFGNNN